jgi:tetratricopeptide (TPR) repeat protein
MRPSEAPSTRIDKSEKLRDFARKFAAPAVAALALIYALFAGLRTVGDMDLGWQMATGRWIIQHHAIPYTDVLSYTGSGHQWIYPVLSQVLFYLLYLLGGYSLLSWASAAACVGTTALLLNRKTITNCLAVIAVPLIAARTAPRAELFSTFFFALFVNVLWNHHRTGRGRLWLLPICMFLWVNLHLGFASGLGMCGAYVAMAIEETLNADRRKAVLNRLRTASPWLMATLGATLLNPWGISNYVGMVRLIPTRSNHWIAELMPVRLTPHIFEQAVAWRDPRSALWWLIVAAVIAMFFSASQRRFVPALMLGASLYLVIHMKRFDAPFATIAVVIGGSILADFIELASRQKDPQRVVSANRLLPAAILLTGVLALVGLAGVRISDLVTNRFYLQRPFQYSTFGPGEASWYPEGATTFLKRERLPGNVFNEYNVGGFVAWSLLPEYPDYIDGRGNPFGEELFFRSLELLGGSLDSPQWQQEADSRGINTILVSLDIDLGTGLSHLDEFCQSHDWRPVYLDTRGAVFLRVRPETANLINRLQLNCASVQFAPRPAATGFSKRAEQFLYHRNAAAILIVLGRHYEALQELKQASDIFFDSSQLHFLKGLALHYTGRTAEAEKELQESLRIEPNDQTSLALTSLYKEQGRLAKAEKVLREAVKDSDRPAGLYLELGFTELNAGTPEPALASFDEAEGNSPFGAGEKAGEEFRARIAAGRQEARRILQLGR